MSSFIILTLPYDFLAVLNVIHVDSVGDNTLIQLVPVWDFSHHFQIHVHQIDIVLIHVAIAQADGFGML